MKPKPALLLPLLLAPACQAQAPEFSDRERLDLVKFWSAPGRYALAPLEDPKGPWKVRLTTDGSLWLWNYNKARGLGKTPPGSVPPAANPQQALWENWIDARVAWDRYVAGADAARKNGLFAPNPVPDPGPAPAELVALAGEPPVFAGVVRPRTHLVTFEDGETIRYADNVEMRPRFAYYRFEDGVQSGGTRVKDLPPGELDALLKRAGITPSEARIFKAVSMLEGGFDSVNTYDTGYVSVGFIQFASLGAGGHSLGETLVGMKRDDPKAFADDFRRYGLDVTPDALLVAVDPRTGEIARGPAANTAIIEDKRLIAVFQRAGRRAPFRVAQLRAAKALYYPAETIVTVKLAGRTLSGKLKEIVRSEAGMAAFMDRKVNTGSLGALPQRLAELATEKGITRFADFAPYEAQLLDALWYRVDPRNDPTLSQPTPVTERARSLPSRRGGRRRRG